MTAWAAEIEADLKWRESELATLKLFCASAAAGSDAQRALLRALWAILYAHYEGFYKFCWDLLLQQIELQKVDRTALTDGFAKLSLSTTFGILRANLSTDEVWEFFTVKMPAEMRTLATFSKRLETKSNLWPNVAKENNKRIAFESNYLDANETKIKLIVFRRNEIAHGKKLIVAKLADYQPYETAALLVMHDIGLFVIRCLDSKDFLKPVSSGSPGSAPVPA